MLIGDIWLRKRPPSSQHLLESGNLKFHPVVSVGQARRGDAESYTGQDQRASPPLSISVTQTPARRGGTESSPFVLRRVCKWLPGADPRRPRLRLPSSPASLLSSPAFEGLDAFMWSD